VSVVICCRDRAELLAAALPQVLDALRPQDELVVVDSASRDGSVAQAADRVGVRALRCPKPGLSRARNLGWQSTDRPLVLFTDDDCRPQPGWVQAAVAAFADPAVGLLWGRVDGDGAQGVQLSVTTDSDPETYDGSGDLSATGHGASLAVRRAALERVGGFDPVLGAGGELGSGEDKDLLWRVVRAGWVARSAPGMAVTHVTWRGDADALRTLYRYGVGAGAVAVKRRRLAGERGLLQGELWRHGLLPAARRVRHGELTSAAGALLRAAGVVAGGWQARRRPMVDGRLVERE
jgi:glycosyltransferase involved in cell wall biosynthesis